MSSIEETIEVYRREVVKMMERTIMFGESRVDDNGVEIGTVDLGEILRQIAGFRARTGYIRALFIDKTDHRYIRFINNLIDPFLDELSELFKIWSRVAAVQELEWNMSRG